MIEAVRANQNDIETILGWVDSWGIPDPYLSDEIYLIKDRDVPVVACGLLESDDGLYIRTYGMVKNPAVKDVQKHMAALFDHLSTVAKIRGHEALTLFAPSEKLAKIYAEHGFVKQHQAVIPMKRDL